MPRLPAGGARWPCHACARVRCEELVNKAEADVMIELAEVAKGSICKAAADCEAARHYRTVPMWAHAPAGLFTSCRDPRPCPLPGEVCFLFNRRFDAEMSSSVTAAQHSAPAQVQRLFTIQQGQPSNAGTTGVMRSQGHNLTTDDRRAFVQRRLYHSLKTCMHLRPQKLEDTSCAQKQMRKVLRDPYGWSSRSQNTTMSKCEWGHSPRGPSRDA